MLNWLDTPLQSTSTLLLAPCHRSDAPLLLDVLHEVFQGVAPADVAAAAGPQPPTAPGGDRQQRDGGGGGQRGGSSGGGRGPVNGNRPKVGAMLAGLCFVDAV